MSLESGKKLGFAASIINIVVPVVVVVVLAAFYAVLISAALGGFSTTPSPLAGTVFSYTFLGIAIAAGVLALVGYILFLVAMHRLSQYYNDSAIFSDLIKALIIQIVSIVILIVVVIALVFISSIGIAARPTTVPTAVLSIFAVYAVVALVFFVISIYCAILYKRSFDRLAEKSGVDSFRTTGMLYLIGTILNIVLIGGIIVWIAWIFASMGYRKLEPLPPAPAPFTPYQAGTGVVKRCPTCGTENGPDAIYCRHCGRLL